MNALKMKILLSAVTAALIVTGLSFEQRLRNSAVFAGIPYDSVSEMEAVAISDSCLTSSGRYLTEASLMNTVSGNGIKTTASGKLLVFFDDDPRLSQGEFFSAAGGLMKSEPDNGGFSFHNPEYFLLFSKNAGLLRLGWKSGLYRIRSELLSSAQSRLMRLDNGSGGILLALFTGSRNMMEHYDTELFRTAGTAHILALSGMHLGIMCGILYIILIPMTGKRAAFIICSVIVVLYLFLTGFGESLVRAALMFFLIGLNEQLNRKSKFTDILILSFVFMTLISPEAFYTISFRLSFVAIAGMVYFGSLFNRVLPNRIPRWLRLSVSASAGAQTAVLPLVLSVFGKVYPAGLISGIVLTPLVTLLIWTGLLFLITGWEMLSICIEFIYKIIRAAAEIFSALPSFGTDNFLIAGTLGFYSVLIISVIFLIIRERYNELSVKL